MRTRLVSVFVLAMAASVPGSSFIGNSVLYPGPTIIGGLGTGVPHIRIALVMEIDAPANGAVYSPGQVVDANWSCSQVPGWGFGAQNCAATTAVGAPINTTLERTRSQSRESLRTTASP